MLEVNGIDAGYGDVQVLWSLSLRVEEKEIVTLLGSNGAGKTTTLRCICGVVRPRSGQVLFNGKSLGDVAPAERAGLGIALVPEGRELWPQLTVRENLELGAYHARAARPGRSSTSIGSTRCFPGCSSAVAVRRQPLRRRAADVRHRRAR